MLPMRQGNRDHIGLGPGDPPSSRQEGRFENVEVDLAGGRGVVPDEPAVRIGLRLPAEPRESGIASAKPRMEWDF